MARVPPTPPSAAIPPLLPGEPPLAVLVDYDGTIAQTDVSDAILSEFVTGEWEARVAEYDAGLVGSRRLMTWEIGLIRAEPDALDGKAAEQPHDPGFSSFARLARSAAVPVEVVSDGFGFFIAPALASLGCADLPIVTAATRFAGGGATIDFPFGNPTCFVCGTCKRDRVLAHQAAGRAVVFIGDGPSDRYAAGYADLVFAKHALEQICIDRGWPFRRWAQFSEIEAWLDATLAAWRGDPAALPPPRARPPFCGAEVWGPGRWDPAAGA